MLQARGLSVELYSLPQAGTCTTLELRPDTAADIFDGFASWRLEEVECEESADSAESLVLQSQEKLREHSAKRSSGGAGTPIRLITVMFQLPSFTMFVKIVEGNVLDQETLTKTEDPAVIEKSLQFLSELMSSSSTNGPVDLSKYQHFAYPPGIKHFPDEIEPNLKVSLHMELLCCKSVPIIEKEPGSGDAACDSSLQRISNKTSGGYAHLAMPIQSSSTVTEEESKKRIALVQEDSIEIEILREYQGVDAAPPVEVKSHFVTEVEEVEIEQSQKASSSTTRPLDEIDILLKSSDELLKAASTVAPATTSSETNSWAVTKLLDESYYNTLRYVVTHTTTRIHFA